jgi:hypothetical protein
MDFQWYGSVTGIVAATIVVVEILKRFFGNTAYMQRVPTWLYAIGISSALTACAHYWWQVLPGNDLDLFTQAIMLAAVASGFKEWFTNVNKPLSASTAARTQRGDV